MLTKRLNPCIACSYSVVCGDYSKDIRDAKLKVQAQIQGDQVRVQSKSKDDLQSVIVFLKQRDFGVDLQFVNYR